MLEQALLVLMLAGAATVADATEHTEKIAQVKAGRLQEAKASWWGFDKADSTKCLQEALDSGVKKLVVDNVGSDWVIGPIGVPSNVEVIFADGVVVRAKKGEFRKKTDKLFNIEGQANVTLRGEGKVLLVMNKSDYQNPDLYQPGGHRHTVNIFNSQNVLVQNLTLMSSGGDGVYVGSSGTGEGAKNVTLDRLICEDHHRLAIAVTGAENLLLKDCKFNHAKGTAPECGIDYEPNYPRFALVGCVAVNCDFDGNAVAGVTINLHQLDATSKPSSLTFTNCRIRGNPAGVRIVSTGSATPQGAGKIEFIDCTIADNERSVVISEHRVSNMQLVFRNCVIDNRKSKTEAMTISSGHPQDITGLRIEGLTVIDDDASRAPIKFISRFGNGIVDAVASGVRVRTSAGVASPFDGAAFLKTSAPSPEAKAFQTLPLELKSLRPVAEQGKTAGQRIRFREKVDFLQWARAGQKIHIKFTNKPVHRYEGKPYRAPLEVVVWCPTRTQVDKFGIPFDDIAEYTLAAAETGVYRFEIDARMQTVSIETDAPGQAVTPAAESLYLFGCSGQLYFHVPAAVKQIKIEAGGSPSENSSVFLLDPKGKEVDSGVRLDGSKILEYIRPDASRAEVWSIKFTASKLFLRVAAPLLPLFSSDPANLLVPTSSPSSSLRTEKSAPQAAMRNWEAVIRQWSLHWGKGVAGCGSTVAAWHDEMSVRTLRSMLPE